MLSVFGEAYGLDMELVARLGRPLGGGMVHSGRTCGAITAAVLILGLATDDPDEAEARRVCVLRVKRLFDRFAALHGSAECRDLLGADWNTPEGLKRIQEEHLVSSLCPAFVRDVATILEELLLEARTEAASCCGGQDPAGRSGPRVA